MNIITVDESRCIGCNACVRVCPVHANTTRIKPGTTDEFITGIVEDACINCGECVKACQHNARGYIDDIDVFIDALEKKEKIILIVAPAVRTSFPFDAWRILLQWIRERGNVEIYDVGFGADICTFMHNKYLEVHEGKKIITQPCPAIVNYIEKYKPNLIPSLSPVMSPVGCLAKWLKVYKHRTEKLFMLSPCIAKTSEARREKAYDYNVTFKNLEKYVEKIGISWEKTPVFKFDELEGGIGRMYPMPGGLKATMQMLNSELVIRNAEGPHSVYDAITRYGETQEGRKADILDVLNCEHGCNHGTAIPDDAANLAEVEQIMDNITAKSIRENAGGFLGIGKMKRFKEFEKTLRLEDFITEYSDKSVKRVTPSPEQFQEVFHMMHKDTVESHVINCGACGYKSCTEMAYAIFNGLNVKENCVHYLKYSLKESYSQLKSIHDNSMGQMKSLITISDTITSQFNDIGNNSEGINKRAKDLASNSLMLKEACDRIITKYSGKRSEELTQKDLTDLQKFLVGIASTANSFSNSANDFAGESGVIKDATSKMSESVSELNKISDSIKRLMEMNK